MSRGTEKTDRTGTGTYSIFGYQNRYNLQDGFPLLTTKKVHLKSIIHELLWFLQGNTNIKYLTDNGVTIWNEWANEDGNLGPVYGKQWRSWSAFYPQFGTREDLYRKESIDQINKVINQIKTDPNSRRLVVTAWNPAEVDQMALAPCHCLFQFNVRDGKYLDCQLYQRSADAFLGVPFNIASYALLIMMVSQVTGLKPGDFIHTFGDLHIYKNHVEQVNEILGREPRALPKMKLNPDITHIDDFRYKDFELREYNPWPMISAPIAK